MACGCSSLVVTAVISGRSQRELDVGSNIRHSQIHLAFYRFGVDEIGSAAARR